LNGSRPTSARRRSTSRRPNRTESGTSSVADGPPLAWTADDLVKTWGRGVGDDAGHRYQRAALRTTNSSPIQVRCRRRVEPGSGSTCMSGLRLEIGGDRQAHLEHP
jgi:hypothetical protein